MADNRPIGIFDSGLGGLTSVKTIKALLPHENIIYFGDTARTPYGSKSVDTINRFAKEIVEFLLNHNVKSIGIACNTVSSSSLINLQRDFPHVHFVDIIEPMVNSLQDLKELSPVIAVIGTEVTIHSGMYEKKIKNLIPKAKVVSKACPLFVNLIEAGLTHDPVLDSVIHKYLDSIMAEEKPDYLILGCTHYPLIADRLQTFYPEVTILNPAISQAEAMKQNLIKYQIEADSRQEARYTFYASDLSEIFQNMIVRIMGDETNMAFKELKLQ